VIAYLCTIALLLLLICILSGDVYFSIMPKADGFDERMRIFKLYHLLNHLNLHGAGFGSGGSSEEPQGYLEKVVNCMLDITGDSCRKGLK
jgi:Fructosamine kinase